MFGEKPTCSSCGKEIEGDEVVMVKLRYPKRRGIAEVRAYLRNEGSFIKKVSRRCLFVYAI